MNIWNRPLPIMSAPMAGATTPELAAAVSNAGGLGFLAAGYLSVPAMAAEVAAYQGLTDAPVAINLFTPQTDRSMELGSRLDAYRAGLVPTAAKYGVEPGDPAFDDDTFDHKVAWLLEHPVHAVTFTFGPVPPRTVIALQEVGTSVGFTVTSAHEAQQAVALGADFVVAQGSEAGGHRGTWNVSDVPNELGAAALTTAAVAASGLPVVAAGGVSGPEDVATLLAAGAVAVSVGTLFLACQESKAPAAHKQALTSREFSESVVTRAFSGRSARALVNDFVREHDGEAPSAYPNVHHMTKPIRTAAAAAGDPQAMALWAGAGHDAASDSDVGELVNRLAPPE
ncbi:nitronate monooxygenase [Nocardioides sp. JQ2195]|uniref:nitronate monooxygenase n=1 Tax=Nocardioides sp. JQ2195 TaxID=2592334 RepID=UPI00143ED037|nr:nitronate monooxygenase [Nocardioides sp. JQ2195]QIX26920.1 nitronate monooxygenase [Nocardioides sp. JQ2195]